jgi:hypothetical protein
MRMIFEENIENEDFFEIILKEDELEKISLKGYVRIFEGGLFGLRDLNVFIRTEKEDPMPLVKGKKASSPKGFSENVKREMHEGKPQKQAVAIAYSEADRGKKKAKPKAKKKK